MSPNWRTRIATARPYSSRNTRSMSEVSRGGGPGLSALLLPERPDFDREGDDARQFSTPLERGVEVRGPDDQEAADVLLAFGVWTVGHQHVAVLVAQDRRGRRRMQAAVEDPRAGRLDLV